MLHRRRCSTPVMISLRSSALKNVHKLVLKTSNHRSLQQGVLHRVDTMCFEMCGVNHQVFRTASLLSQGAEDPVEDTGGGFTG
ncbi:hypothetical protein [Gluconobacter thailandicus]|uniref:hypothetical protein n=1 Tax=Gluconobacter thailandicus TaxID=257438 RepID=UPI00142FCD2D|nr:hypothetical protein [Gluconobacter thailandicus]